MYLKKSTNKKTNRTYLTIATGYRDPITKLSKTKIIKSLGYLDVLQKEYNDPISHFTEVVNQMNEKEKQNNLPMSVIIDKNEKLETNTNCNIFIS